MSGASWPILLRVVIYWGMCAALSYFAFMQMESSMRIVSFGLAAITFLAGLASARWLVKPSIKTHQ